MAGIVHAKHSTATGTDGGSRLRRPLDETRSQGQGVAASLLSAQRRLPLLLRRHQRLFRIGYFLHLSNTPQSPHHRDDVIISC